MQLRSSGHKTAFVPKARQSKSIRKAQTTAAGLVRDLFDVKNLKTPYKARQTKLVFGKGEMNLAEMSAAEQLTQTKTNQGKRGKAAPKARISAFDDMLSDISKKT